MANWTDDAAKYFCNTQTAHRYVLSENDDKDGFKVWFNYFSLEVPWSELRQNQLANVKNFMSLIYKEHEKKIQNDTNQQKKFLTEPGLPNFEHSSYDDKNEDKEKILKQLLDWGFKTSKSMGQLQSLADVFKETGLEGVQKIFPHAIETKQGAVALVYRGDSRKFSDLKDHKGFLAKVDVAPTKNRQYGIWNQHAPWNPFHRKEINSPLYFRKGKKDNCIYTAVSVAPDWQLALGYPMVRGSIYTYPDKKIVKWDKKDWQTMQNSQANLSRIKCLYGRKEISAVCFTTTNYLYVGRVKDEFVDTEAAGDKEGHENPSYERAVKGIPMNQILAGIKFLRIHPSPGREMGAWCIPQEIKYYYGDAWQKPNNNNDLIKQIAAYHFDKNQEIAKKVVEKIQQDFQLNRAVAGGRDLDSNTKEPTPPDNKIRLQLVDKTQMPKIESIKDWDDVGPEDLGFNLLEEPYYCRSGRPYKKKKPETKAPSQEEVQKRQLRQKQTKQFLANFTLPKVGGRPTSFKKKVEVSDETSETSKSNVSLPTNTNETSSDLSLSAAEQPILLNGMKFLFDRPVPVSPVSLIPRDRATHADDGDQPAPPTQWPQPHRRPLSPPRYARRPDPLQRYRKTKQIEGYGYPEQDY